MEKREEGDENVKERQKGEERELGEERGGRGQRM